MEDAAAVALGTTSAVAAVAATAPGPRAATVAMVLTYVVLAVVALEEAIELGTLPARYVMVQTALSRR